MIATHRTNVILRSADNSPTQSGHHRVYSLRLSRIYLPSCERAMETIFSLFATVTMAPHMLLSFSQRACFSSIDAQNGTRSQFPVGPFTSEFSIRGKRRHRITDKLILIINASRLYVIYASAGFSPQININSHAVVAILRSASRRAAPRHTCIYY